MLDGTIIQCDGRTFEAKKVGTHSCDGCVAKNTSLCLALPTCSFDSVPADNIIFIEAPTTCNE